MVVDSRAFSGSVENLVLGIFQIVLIDLVLAGDNAVVIAMACTISAQKKTSVRHHLRRRACRNPASSAHVFRLPITSNQFCQTCRRLVNILDRMQTAASRRGRAGHWASGNHRMECNLDNNSGRRHYVDRQYPGSCSGV